MNKKIEYIAIIMFLCLSFMLIFASEGYSGELIQTHFDSLQDSGWSYFSHSGGKCDIVTDSSSHDPPNVLRFVYPPGLQSGNSVCMAYFEFPAEQTELNIQYYIKFASNFTFQSIGQKMIYILTGTDQSTPHHSVKVTGDRHLWLEVVGYNSLFSNTGYNPTIEINRWYKININEIINTPGASNGVFQASIDDKPVFDYSNIPFRPSGVTKGWGAIKIDPIWGGSSSQLTTREMYIYIDGMNISTTGNSINSNINIAPSSPNNLKVD